MMIQDTSRVAYREIKKKGLGDRQRAVLDVIRHLKNPTNSEISRFMGIPINAITPRTNELVKAGKVIQGLKRTCHVTGKTVLTWRALLPNCIKGCGVRTDTLDNICRSCKEKNFD